MWLSRSPLGHIRCGRAAMLKTLANSSRPEGHSIQQLYDSLSSIRDVYAAATHPAQCPNLVRCLDIMDSVTLPEVGLDKYDLTSLEESVCMSIYSSNKFDISLFIVPAGLAMPLHDHPNMAVLSKLLLGSALCTSYTQLQPMQSTCVEDGTEATSTPISGPFFKRDVQVKDADSNAWYLTPTAGNIHAIHALQSEPPAAKTAPVVMLDVLLPPYDSLTRPCRFYTASAHPMWVPTASVALAADEPEVLSEGGDSNGNVKEWKWKKWMLEETEEPTEQLPYAVQYQGSLPL